MPRGRKKAVQPSNVQPIIDALQFINIAQSDTGSEYQQHCLFTPGFLMAANGTLQAGIKLEHTVTACPHTGRLLAALTSAKEAVQLSVLGEYGRIGVEAGPFKAAIETVSPDLIPPIFPDPNVAAIDNAKFRTALEVVGRIVKEGHERVICAAIWFTNAGTCVGTDSKLLIEYHHGISLPRVFVPKASIIAMTKVPKAIVGLGASNNSITFWYDDGSWIKTNVYDTEAVDHNQMFNDPHNTGPVPDKFFDAVEALAPLCDEFLYFAPGKIATDVINEGTYMRASYDVPTIAGSGSINPTQMLLIKDIMKTIDLSQTDRRVVFYGENLRGAISGLYNKE